MGYERKEEKKRKMGGIEAKGGSFATHSFFKVGARDVYYPPPPTTKALFPNFPLFPPFPIPSFPLSSPLPLP